MPRANTRAKLLEAASAVIRRDGAQGLTLDAVAAEAGVSKGGLLYHFASKRDLLDGLVERWLDEFQEDIDAAGPGFVAGYVRASDGAKAEEAGLLAALVADPPPLPVVVMMSGQPASPEAVVTAGGLVTTLEAYAAAEADQAGTPPDIEFHALAGSVIQLEQSPPDYGEVRRRARVVKVRGLPHLGGYHNFRIRTGGLEAGIAVLAQP